MGRLCYGERANSSLLTDEERIILSMNHSKGASSEVRELQTEFGCGDEDRLVCAIGEGRVVFYLCVCV